MTNLRKKNLEFDSRGNRFSTKKVNNNGTKRDTLKVLF